MSPILRVWTIFSLATAVAASSGCVSPIVQNYRYLGDSSESFSREAPPGFEISPRQAYQIFESFHGPQKTIQDVYYGADRYFVIDGFLGSTPSDAVLFGTFIDGKTGQVFDAEKSSWSSVPPWRDASTSREPAESPSNGL
jgi:hypothetical protein